MNTRFRQIIFFSAILSFSSAYAGLFKVGVTSISEIIGHLKKGTALSKTIGITPYSGVARQQTRALFYVAQAPGKNPIYVVVTKNARPSMDQLTVELLQKADATAAQAIAKIPNSYRFSEEITPEVAESLAKTELNAQGRNVINQLSKIEGAKITNESLGTMAHKLEQMGMESSNVVLIGRGDSGIGIVSNIGEEGAGASFTIRLGFSRNATPEEISEVLETITQAL